MKRMYTSAFYVDEIARAEKTGKLSVALMSAIDDATDAKSKQLFDENYRDAPQEVQRLIDTFRDNMQKHAQRKAFRPPIDTGRRAKVHEKITTRDGGAVYPFDPPAKRWRPRGYIYP